MQLVLQWELHFYGHKRNKCNLHLISAPVLVTRSLQTALLVLVQVYYHLYHSSSLHSCNHYIITLTRALLGLQFNSVRCQGFICHHLQGNTNVTDLAFNMYVVNTDDSGAHDGNGQLNNLLLSFLQNSKTLRHVALNSQQPQGD
jgi:hypothetical protein